MALYRRWSAISANATLSKIKRSPTDPQKSSMRRPEKDVMLFSREKHLTNIIAVFRLGRTVAFGAELRCSASVCVET